MKKVLAIVLALVMALSMSAMAFAADGAADVDAILDDIVAAAEDSTAAWDTVEGAIIKVIDAIEDKTADLAAVEGEVINLETVLGGVPGVDWWRKKDLSGGQAVEQTIHQFDIIRYVFGEPEEVCTYGTRGFLKGVPDYNTDDLSTTIIKFKSGALGVMSTGDYATSGNSHDSKVIFSSKDKRAELKILGTLKIYGEKPVEAENDGGGGFIVKGDGALSAGGDCVVYNQDGDAGVLCDRTFIEAVISGDGSKIRSPYADAFKSVSFTMACNKSMELGVPVKVELE